MSWILGDTRQGMGPLTLRNEFQCLVLLAHLFVDLDLTVSSFTVVRLILDDFTLASI